MNADKPLISAVGDAIGFPLPQEIEYEVERMCPPGERGAEGGGYPVPQK